MPLMIISVSLMVLIMLLLLWIAAWFSSTETALTNLQSHEIASMKRNNEKNVDYIIKLRDDMDRTLITILIGNDIVNVLLSSLAALFANALFDSLGISITIGLITFLIIIFGDICPKSAAIMHNKRISKKNAKAVYLTMMFFSPIVSFFIVLSKIILWIGGIKSKPKGMLISDDQIKSLASLHMEKGNLKEIEKDIIHKVFNFGDARVHDIMVPMKDVFALRKNYSVEEAKSLIAEQAYTRVPVIVKNKVLGLIYSKDLLKYGPEKRIEDLLRVTFVVPAYYDITVLFSLMKKVRIHMAIVKDRKGSHIGIATMEDILEELVGEIYDEFSEKKFTEIQKLGDE